MAKQEIVGDLWYQSSGRDLLPPSSCVGFRTLSPTSVQNLGSRDPRQGGAPVPTGRTMSQKLGIFVPSVKRSGPTPRFGPKRDYKSLEMSILRFFGGGSFRLQ